ncbi:hypothetical protein [Cohnella abietis]|uniref:Uncharacterized protein n=1 Tax=Cohnella abietis TaxID=2507935 RepID=A0A3T1CZZ5_9BACL|nr:hypothetical protein [Cohnella abietis]BBI31335.1 hypothetical protein KCTCHS21_07340 [Cohnella abietis]
MALDLELAEIFIQNKLQAIEMSHLYVRTQSKSLVIFSMEQDEEAIRAILTQFSGDEFLLSIADPRGEWQLIPHTGTLTEMVEVLTDELTFALARWP